MWSICSKVFNPTKIYVEWGCKCLFYYIRRNITDINIDANWCNLTKKVSIWLKATIYTYYVLLDACGCICEYIWYSYRNRFVAPDNILFNALQSKSDHSKSFYFKNIKVRKGESAALKNSISLMNSGNYGLPVSQLIFSHNPVGVSIQIFIVIFQNLLTYSYGIYNLLSATKQSEVLFNHF